MTYPTGVILALHKGRPKGDFVVSLRVTGTEYPQVNIQKHIKEVMATGGYYHVWFVPIDIPDMEVPNVE